MFDRSKLESLRDASVNRIGDTFRMAFLRLSLGGIGILSKEIEVLVLSLLMTF